MPAKKEYLTTRSQRALKISAGILGGYFLTAALHLFVAALFPFRNEVLLTATFSFFILWVTLMILAFLSRNGWKIWGIYLLSSLLFTGIVYFIR
ncbi:hypothetical protein [Dyadobacter diqingensis]|uniref:hypothetical protein n=1 Tax=Dyadobacter diqingensis TaxID=2938121 RepID=UPI0020C589E1|nr:hypothetical protein [Dyadobacter diqingensis]